MNNFLTHPEKVEAVSLWYRGRDTVDIAKHFNVPESLIANNLRHWREGFKELALRKATTA